MQRYTEDLIGKAQLIRKDEKLSFSQIGRRLNVPNSTIRNWCFGLGVLKSESVRASNEAKRQELKLSEINIVPEFEKISAKDAKFIVALLYGCEGAKYPASTSLSFSNSDPNLVSTFYKLLRVAYVIDVAKIHIQLQIHTTHNYAEVRKFWSGLLKVPESQFQSPTIREPKGGKHRQKYLGTCSLRYGDYKIQLKMQGIYQKFLENLSSEQ